MAAVAAATADDILDSNPKSVARAEKEKEDDGNSDIKKREKSIVEWIGQPLKPPSRNEDEEDEDEAEYFGVLLSSTEDVSPGDKDNEGCEDNWKDGRYLRP